MSSLVVSDYFPSRTHTANLVHSNYKFYKLGEIYVRSWYFLKCTNILTNHRTMKNNFKKAVKGSFASWYNKRGMSIYLGECKKGLSSQIIWYLNRKLQLCALTWPVDKYSDLYQVSPFQSFTADPPSGAVLKLRW